MLKCYSLLMSSSAELDAACSLFKIISNSVQPCTIEDVGGVLVNLSCTKFVTSLV